MESIIIGVCSVYSIAELCTVLPIEPTCVVMDGCIVRTASLELGEIVDRAIFSDNRALIYDKSGDSG